MAGVLDLEDLLELALIVFYFSFVVYFDGSHVV